MWMKMTVASAVMIGLSALLLVARGADEEGKPAYTIKQVMAKAHKSKLVNKLAEGKGTKAEAQELVDLYKALGANKPPKGDLEGWKAKTAAMVEAAQDVLDGKEGAGARLQKAANCANCHKEHKGK